MKVDEKYIYGHCVSPLKIQLCNPLTRELETREVPCGHCLHCRSTRVSEWVTRMTLQSMYSVYTYFVTLTYDSSKLTSLVSSDASLVSDLCLVEHNINQNGVYQLSPLVLCKRHIQLYWKRFRKNTGIKIQYYCIGEYGHNFGRPHYHAIIWSDVAITAEQFQSCWPYGHLDVEDVKSNAAKIGIDPLTSYRYVCKYLYKDFNFNSIPTIKYHKLNYERLYQLSIVDKAISLVSTLDEGEVLSDDSIPVKNPYYTFEDYVRTYGTFMCCSKSPAIGSRYLSEHLSKFQKGDLRIFGVHGKDLIFPRFYTRKIKESLCPCVSLSPRNGSPCSPSSTFDLVSNVMDFCSTVASYKDLAGLLCETGEYSVPSSLKTKHFYSLDFYDTANNEYYLLSRSDTPLMNGIYHYKRYKYNRHTRSYDMLGIKSCVDVMLSLESLYNSLVKYIVRPFEESRKLREKDFRDYILVSFGSLDNYHDYVQSLYDNEIKMRKQRQLIYNQTKLLF